MPPPPPARGWTILFVVLTILACLVAAVATALYLSAAYLTPGAGGTVYP